MKVFNDVSSLAAATLTADQIVKVKDVGEYRIKASGSGITLANGNIAVPVASGTAVNVKQFGAVGDGVADDTAAIQAAIDSVITNGGGSVYFPEGHYHVLTPVSINFDSQCAIRLHGNSSSNYFAADAGGAKLTGANGIESIFLLTKTNLTIAGGYAFECDHLMFSALGGGATSALKNVVAGAPARPFVVSNCGFTGFERAIQSDISASGLTTGICQVTIRESTFVAGNYALYGTGGAGSIMDLDFRNNASENGGRIYISNLGGSCNISDNLLEGQTDAIDITCGLGKVEIKRNYFEVNSGFLIKLNATNNNSSYTEESNYVLNSTGGRVYFRNGSVFSKTNWKEAGVFFDCPLASPKSSFDNNGVINPYVWGTDSYSFDLNSISKFTSVPAGTLTNGGYSTLGGSSEVTPVGTLNYTTLASTFSAWMTPASISLSANDVIVGMALVRRTSGNPNLYLAVYDNAYGGLSNSTTSFPLSKCGIGEWVLVVSIVKVPSSSSGAPRCRWVTSAGTADVTSTYFYQVNAPTNNLTEAYVCMLNP